MKISDEKIKNVIATGKKFLQKNDLDGFYDYLSVNEDDANTISSITRYIEKIGIPTIKYLSSIPHYYCFDAIVDKYLTASNLINDSVLSFPKNIKEIGYYAFSGAEGFYTVDLRNVKILQEGAFEESSVTDIFFGDDFTFISGSFYDCNIKTIYLPDNDKFELNKESILNSGAFNSDPKKIFFDVY